MQNFFLMARFQQLVNPSNFEGALPTWAALYKRQQKRRMQHVDVGYIRALIRFHVGTCA